jgi:hypothetical protein
MKNSSAQRFMFPASSWLRGPGSGLLFGRVAAVLGGLRRVRGRGRRFLGLLGQFLRLVLGRCAAVFADWQSCSDSGDELVDPIRSHYRVFVNGEPVTETTSGALHDAAILAPIIPTIMLFVASKDGIVAVALPASPKTDPGRVVFLDAATGGLLGSVQVGALPDMVTFTPDGTKVLEGIAEVIPPAGPPGGADTPFDIQPRRMLQILLDRCRALPPLPTALTTCASTVMASK